MSIHGDAVNPCCAASIWVHMPLSSPLNMMGKSGRVYLDFVDKLIIGCFQKGGRACNVTYSSCADQSGIRF